MSSSSINTAKETTPVVSANCDAEEVTLPPKLHKDRESPVKGRKLNFQPKIPSSTASVTSLVSEPLTSSNNEEKSLVGEGAKKQKDVSSLSTTVS